MNNNIRSNPLQFLISIDRFLFLVEKSIISFGMIIMALNLAFSIIYRAILGKSIIWAGELSQYIAVWVVFIGASMCIRMADHVNVDVLLNAFPEKGKRLLNCFIFLTAGSFMVYLSIVGWNLTWEIYALGQTASYMPFSMAWVYLSFPIGTLLMAINFFKNFIQKIVEIKSQ